MPPVPPTVTHRRLATPPLWIVELTGEHDVSTATDVDMILTQAVASGDPIVVDLEHATFADSSILSVILTAEHRAGPRKLAVVVPNDGEVNRLFGLVDVSAMLVTFPTLDEAIERCYHPDPP